MDLDCQQRRVRDRREQVIVLQKGACGSPCGKAKRAFKVVERLSLLIILSFKARECHDRIHSLEELLLCLGHGAALKSGRHQGDGFKDCCRGGPGRVLWSPESSWASQYPPSRSCVGVEGRRLLLEEALNTKCDPRGESGSSHMRNNLEVLPV